MNPALQLADALASLAEDRDPDLIARYLHALGVRGWPRDRHACPVASYLAARLPWATSVDVGGRVAVYFATDRQVITHLPDAVARFVVQFDCGEWPELRAAPMDVVAL